MWLGERESDARTMTKGRAEPGRWCESAILRLICSTFCRGVAICVCVVDDALAEVAKAVTVRAKFRP